MAIPMQTVAPGQDSYSWGPSPNGLFQVKSAYCVAKSIPFSQKDSWSWVWSLCTLPRIQHFIWQLRHERLLTRDTLYGWGVGDSNLCALCGDAPETLDHLFRECAFSNLLWTAITPYHLNDIAQGLCFTEWLEKNCCNHSDDEGIKWSTIYATAIWALWFFRNQRVHKGISFSIQQAKEFIYSKAREFQHACNTHGGNFNKETILVNWSPPPEGYIKLNTDGSALSNPGQTGAGGVFRDHMGNWLLGFMRNVGYSTVLTAEL
ncbi:hypothetical protein SLA2020_260900 [Shorea laevis]